MKKEEKMKRVKKLMCRIFGHSLIRIKEVYAFPVARRGRLMP